MNVEPTAIVLTTGTARGALYDANDDPNNPTDITDAAECGGSPCKTAATGAPFDCDALAADPTGGLSGGVLVGAWPMIDAPQLGDAVVSINLAFR